MLAERPCLATGAEGVADLIRPEFGAIAQPENDPEALQALLGAYLADPALGPRQGKAARAWAERQYARPVVGPSRSSGCCRPRGERASAEAPVGQDPRRDPAARVRVAPGPAADPARHAGAGARKRLRRLEDPRGIDRRGRRLLLHRDRGDITFDLELIRRYGAVVRAVDPVAAYGAASLEAAAGEPRFSFRHAAVTTRDAPIRMQVHHEPGSQSLSAAGLYDSDEWVEVDGRTIPTLMREFGDDRVDLMKIDVEGIEYDLVPTLDLAALSVRVFAIQLHHTGTVRDATTLIRGLERQGFRLVAQKPPVRLTLARIPTNASTTVTAP